MSVRAIGLLGFLALGLVSCSTSGKFIIPEGSQLEIYQRPVQLEPDGSLEMKPFFWSAAGGVKYRLLKDGEVLKEGTLRAEFRVVSIFWPPFALIYWPMGLNPNITYDLVNDTQE